jgi:hypothetical protein
MLQESELIRNLQSAYFERIKELSQIYEEENEYSNEFVSSQKDSATHEAEKPKFKLVN